MSKIIRIDDNNFGTVVQYMATQVPYNNQDGRTCVRIITPDGTRCLFTWGIGKDSPIGHRENVCTIPNRVVLQAFKLLNARPGCVRQVEATTPIRDNSTSIPALKIKLKEAEREVERIKAQIYDLIMSDTPNPQIDNITNNAIGQEDYSCSYDESFVGFNDTKVDNSANNSTFVNNSANNYTSVTESAKSDTNVSNSVQKLPPVSNRRRR